MSQMTDPTTALLSFQEELTKGNLPLQPGVIDRNLFLYVDSQHGPTRFTYVRLDHLTVTAFAIFVGVDDIDGAPCLQAGCAVPERYRRQGRAKEIVTAAIAELKRGLTENGVPVFYIEAVVGVDNKPSMSVAAATISPLPVKITDEVSGLPALQYVRKIERESG